MKVDKDCGWKMGWVGETKYPKRGIVGKGGGRLTLHAIEYGIGREK